MTFNFNSFILFFFNLSSSFFFVHNILCQKEEEEEEEMNQNKKKVHSLSRLVQENLVGPAKISSLATNAETDFLCTSHCLEGH